MSRSTDRARVAPIALAVGVAALAVALALPAPTTPGPEALGVGASGALGTALGAPPAANSTHRFAIRSPRTVGTERVVRVRFAGSGRPGAVVVVHYAAPESQVATVHVAEVEPGSSAVGPTGRFAFTAALPELPRGAERASWSALLIDPASLAVIGRVEGVHLVEQTDP
ncbi:hypothetical protein [Curtobacterium sp. MCBA15_005]|uniref:hypothetical protein n=1 Tax=Curtobacterium sp. MCBA15_005 TaxID=1898734 RepID=UPI0008DE0F6D|nr:hypothetical protein [Curtobacterium sp. MCBA15_005]OII07864.1 hypothetical protein BIU89_07235 [Curtobacterium sp. MCBA15_005]